MPILRHKAGLENGGIIVTGIEILWAALMGLVGGIIGGVMVTGIWLFIEWTRGEL